MSCPLILKIPCGAGIFHRPPLDLRRRETTKEGKEATIPYHSSSREEDDS